MRVEQLRRRHEQLTASGALDGTDRDDTDRDDTDRPDGPR